MSETYLAYYFQTIRNQMSNTNNLELKEYAKRMSSCPR